MAATRRVGIKSKGVAFLFNDIPSQIHRCIPATPPIQGSSLCAALRTPLHKQVLPFIRHKVHAELVVARFHPSSVSARLLVPFLNLIQASCSPVVTVSARPQESFAPGCAPAKFPTDAKLTLKASIVSQSLNDLFDKVVYRVSANIPRRPSK
ncbi:hypothetical protein BDQ94DRAFT_164611 [Aspergillus welwitschiae]|uniref:Uncharacterized protein n=1 Tax=Aspergillus welwitschiae TaxID=1341132 RepID=A0A3F3PIV1_9EURO|nr:hypothetical protein BDQ94DRAFT_164611 [Aspergillus welwitschiae]RDH26276.1 hypothetical protein BDQ94DRAFT_164611 [Aspergillus welwitschiae]